jgi:hypothetical protein
VRCTKEKSIAVRSRGVIRLPGFIVGEVIHDFCAPLRGPAGMPPGGMLG